MNDDLKEFADILFAPRERDELKQLNEYNNTITNVELSETELHNDEYEYRYEIFVYTNNDKVRLLRCDGDDGNGYYGSGYWITVNLEGEYYEKE